MKDPAPLPCPYCGRPGGRVAVHGHVQCGACGTNLEPCCGGASAADEAPAQTHAETLPDPHLFERLFRRLGGEAATVTADCLQRAVVEHLDCDLEAAGIVIAAGERTGGLVRVGSAAFRLGRRRSI